MANLGNDREEFVGSQRDDHFVNLKHRRDRDQNPTPSVRVETQHIEYTERSHSRTGSLISYDQVTWNLKLEIDHLRKKLQRRERDKRGLTSPPSEGSDRDRDRNYRRRYYNQTFEQKSGFFKHIGPDGLPQDEAAGSVDDDNTTIGPADCRARCWNNCDCRGFNGDEGTGCQYWTGNVKFEPDDGVSRSRILKYVLRDPPKGESSK
nr:hypothetical protein CFP56_51264 [Quercus suber]